MSVVNFQITKPLDIKINTAIKKQGFASKAEFFRFAAFHYLQHFGDDISQEEYEASVRSLKKAVRDRYGHQKLPSLHDQFADLR